MTAKSGVQAWLIEPTQPLKCPVIDFDPQTPHRYPFDEIDVQRARKRPLRRLYGAQLEVVRRIEADAEWKLLSDPDKAKLAAMSLRYYEKLKSELKVSKVENPAQVRGTGTPDSTIPEPENEADSEWKMLTIDEKVKLSSMSRRWYLKLKSELETPEVQTSAQVHQSGTEDSTIPEPENEADSALKPTPSAKIEGSNRHSEGNSRKRDA